MTLDEYKAWLERRIEVTYFSRDARFGVIVAKARRLGALGAYKDALRKLDEVKP